jgi:hypothetical protein
MLYKLIKYTVLYSTPYTECPLNILLFFSYFNEKMSSLIVTFAAMAVSATVITTERVHDMKGRGGEGAGEVPGP